MKKFYFFILFFIIFSTCAIVTAYFFPNELSFKIANDKKNFYQAEEIFPKWGIISRNNGLGELYKQKKYREIKREISKISENKCSLKKERISEFCANIFYLSGLTEYQLGKDLESKKQKIFFEKAISEFTKVMIMSDKNSEEYVWSKENIEFLQKKFQETQKKEQGKKKEKKKSQQQEKQGKNSQNKQNKSEKNSENSKRSTGENNNKNKEQQKSRLPKQMQQAIQKVQKQLEENQKNSQKGFNRSQSAAQKNKQNYDPFEDMRNDPFFQDFFGNDPFFQQAFPQRRNYSNQLQNPNIKDW